MYFVSILNPSDMESLVDESFRSIQYEIHKVDKTPVVASSADDHLAPAYALSNKLCDFAPYDLSLASQEIAVLASPPCHCIPPVHTREHAHLSRRQTPASSPRLMPDPNPTSATSTTHPPHTAAPSNLGPSHDPAVFGTACRTWCI